MNLPYIGSYSQFHKPHNETVWYGGECEGFYQEYLAYLKNQPVAEKDISSRWGYQFNSQGFRGEEYQSSGGYTIAVVGCSIAIGEGVPWEQTFGYHLRERIRLERRGEPIQYLNFSQSGASNDYITRTAIRQSEAVKPDLLVVYFTHVARKEVVEQECFHSFGSWCAGETELFKSVLGCYSHQEAVINTLKNMFILQEYCRTKNIPYIFTLQEFDKLNVEPIVEHPAIRDYWRLIDWLTVTPFRMRWADRARDNRHPCPCSQREFAEKLFGFLQRD